MTINALARMMVNRDRYQQQSATPNLPNGSLPPKGHVNPYCPEGMDITGMKESDFKSLFNISACADWRDRFFVLQGKKPQQS